MSKMNTTIDTSAQIIIL